MDELTRRALIRALIAFLAVLFIGGTTVFTVGVLRDRGQAQTTASPTPSTSASPDAGLQAQTWLTWVPGGLPEGFGSQLTTVRLVDDVTVATADIAWMTGSVDAAGVPVDTPTDPFMIPIDTTGFEPAFTSFVPQPERSLVSGLGESEGILSETAATLRGVGEDATLTFDTGQIITIAGTLPDHLMGGYELLVTRTTGEMIGVRTERYVLFHLRRNATGNPTRLARLFLPYITEEHPYYATEVRAPGETRYLRANDRELPPALLKVRFGEFTAYPNPSDPDGLRIDPAWTEERIVTEKIPVFGEVTCHQRVLGYLTKIADELLADEAGRAVSDVGDCFEPFASAEDPSGPLTARPFGAMIDVNERENDPGETPKQETVVLREMYRGGFGWGGRDAYPQGSRFRYVHPPKRAN